MHYVYLSYTKIWKNNAIKLRNINKINSVRHLDYTGFSSFESEKVFL